MNIKYIDHIVITTRRSRENPHVFGTNKKIKLFLFDLLTF